MGRKTAIVGLNENATFDEIRTWFREQYKTLPDSLATPFKEYHDVRAFVVLNIKQIENQINKHGKGIRHSKLAKSSKANLIELYDELKKHS